MVHKKPKDKGSRVHYDEHGFLNSLLLAMLGSLRSAFDLNLPTLSTVKQSGLYNHRHFKCIQTLTQQSCSTEDLKLKNTKLEL